MPTKKSQQLTTFNPEFAAKQLGLAAKIADLMGGIFPIIEATIIQEVKSAIERLQVKLLRLPIDAAKRTPEALNSLIWSEIDAVKSKKTRETLETLLNRVGIHRPSNSEETK